MKNVILLLYFFLTIESLNAQEYGRIYTKTEANALYGNVLVSIEISSAELNGYMFQTKDYLMFNIIDGELIILDNERKSLRPVGEQYSLSMVFKVYSISKMQELLNQGKEKIVKLEARENVISITNGDFTLEFSGNCPPVCP
ncbi:MAG: hypothetical protein NTX22_17085 [Ignavibacteriales bacterium]|nr:hypothetical protein [Ignavibacteriales bacterium]